jgi:peptide/nickel transport system substrate-binding protein
MRTLLHRLLAGAVTASLLAALAAPAAAQSAPAPLPGGAVRVGTPADPDGLDPHRSPADSTFIIVMNIFDSLVATNPSGQLLPGLAAKWTISPNGLAYTFMLRSGVTFHNGKPLTAADVKYSLARMAEKGKSPHAADYAIIEGVETPDPATVRITLKRPSARFLSDLAYGWAAIVPEGAGDELRQKPLGTGPFRFVEWVPDSHIRLARNPRYFVAGRPYLDDLVFRVMPDETARLTALKAGELDLADRIPPQSVAELRAVPTLKVETFPRNTLSEIAVNQEQKPFNDLRVRRALFHGVDRKAVLDGAVFGFGRLIGSFMPPIIKEYYVDLNGRYSYDPAKAKALLAEAGFPNGFDTTLYLPQPYSDFVKSGEIAAAQLKKVGVNAKLVTLEWGAWLDKIYKKHDYGLTTIGHVGRLDPITLLERFKSGYNANYFGYANKEYDRLVEEADVTHDRAKRREMVVKLQRFLSEDAVSVWLFSTDGIVASQKDVHGYSELPIPGNRLLDVYRAGK